MREKVIKDQHKVKDIKAVKQEILLEGLGEYVRLFVKKALEEAIQGELTEFLGHRPYERGGLKDNYRNGFYQRDLHTRFGPIEDLRMARDRRGKFRTEVIGRYSRREEKIDRDVIALFIGGISTRGMRGITRRLLGKGYSAGTISRINKRLTESMRDWMKEAIEEDIAYIFLDGLNLPVRRFAVSRESLLMAIGITHEGHRKVLGVQLGDKESATSWREFLKELKARGLKGDKLRLGTMDGLPGLERVFEEEFPRTPVQRCVVHKLRNIAARLPRGLQKDCMSHCKRIFYASSLEEAEKRFQDWKAGWAKATPSAVECLEKDLKSVLQFYLFPREHWRRIRTTNIIERAFKEFRRRTRQMDSLPNEECCLRIVYAISQELNERWRYRVARTIPLAQEGSNPSVRQMAMVA